MSEKPLCDRLGKLSDIHMYYISSLDSIGETCIYKSTVFATEITVKSELYQKGIISAGHEFIFMEQWQAKVNSIINAIKMKRDREFIHSLWNELINEVKDQCVDSVIMACTYLSILSNVTGLKLNIYDSSEALAKSVVKIYLKSKQE